MKSIALLVSLAGSFAAGRAPAADLLIRDARIVDVRTGNILPHRSILIHGDRIRSIGFKIRAPRGAHIVEARDRYVIPGLWDMNVHLWYKQSQLPMYVAWGVTGVRDMGSELAEVKRWRQEIRSGEMPGPHIETCGPMVDGFPSADAKLPIIVVRSPVEARSVYDDLDLRLNVNFVGVGSRLPRDAYFALIERARKWGLPVAGPVPDAVMVDEAVTARQSSIEGLSNVLLACSTEERKLLLPRATAIERNDKEAMMTFLDRELATFDPRKADGLFERMARYGSYQTPSLVTLLRATYGDVDGFVRDPHLRYIPAAVRKTWDDPRAEKSKLPDASLALLAREYEKDAYIVDRMQRLGVPILAGSGSGEPYTVPGSELHRELQLLVKAGLNPLQALRAATISPAEYLNADESLGTVEQGKIADLVLLDADPLQDISNTRKIFAVIVGGKYLSKAKLESLLRGGAGGFACPPEGSSASAAGCQARRRSRR